MSNFDDPYTKKDLATALLQAHYEVARFFMTIPRENFCVGVGEAWSPAQDLEHLVKSVQPVAMALRLPKLLPRLLFGAATAPSRTYTVVRDDYLGHLAAGAESPGSFLPTRARQTGDPEATRVQLLARWERTGQALLDGLALWSEAELDHYRLPHPLLGKISVREMLLFTLYHNRHHAGAAQG